MARRNTDDLRRSGDHETKPGRSGCEARGIIAMWTCKIPCCIDTELLDGKWGATGLAQREHFGDLGRHLEARCLEMMCLHHPGRRAAAAAFEQIEDISPKLVGYDDLRLTPGALSSLARLCQRQRHSTPGTLCPKGEAGIAGGGAHSVESTASEPIVFVG